VSYAVVRTYDAHALARDREKFIARLAQFSEGGLWTIETGGRKGGLHVNLIIGTLDGIAASKLAACWPSGSSADFWAAEIPRGDARHVAAYCAKRETMPDGESYAGRLYGSWGAWKRPLAAMVEDRAITPPEVAGAALQTMLHAVLPEPSFKDAADDREQARNARLKTLFAAHAGELAMHGCCYIPGYGVATLAEARRIGAL